MAYITKSDVQNHLGITIDSALDAYVATVIDGAKDYVETLCGGGIIPKRVFEAGDVDSTRYYDGDGSTILTVDDLRSVTSLSIDGDVLVNGEDYYLLPYNASTDGEPYTQIALIQPETRINGNSRMIDSDGYVFEIGQRNVVVTGKFGYSTTVPNAVKLATLRIVAQFLKDNIGDNAMREQASESLGEYSSSFVRIKEVADRLNVTDMLGKYIHPLSSLSPRTEKGGARVAMFKVS